MKKYFLRYIIIIGLFIVAAESKGQDIHFSQFMETPLLRNPALSGIFTGDLRVQAVYRNQWNTIAAPYQTSTLNAEYKLPIGRGDDYLTIGGWILYDKAGTAALSATHVMPVINYHKSLSEERNIYLSAGFSGGIVQRRVDRNKMTTNNQWSGTGFDPNLGNGETFADGNFLYFDGSAGLSLNMQIGQNVNNNVYVGFAYHHFNPSAKVSFYNAPDVTIQPKIVLSGGLRMEIDESSFFTLQGDLSKQGPYSEYIGGGLYSYRLGDVDYSTTVFSIGAFLRWRSAIIPMIKVDLMPFTFGLSYDMNISSLKSGSQYTGGFELSLSYQKFFEKNSSKDVVRCPKF
jgi:type IX secretion system PorP/SprF family membrane protein